MKKIYYYNSYNDDVIESSNQDYQLKDSYKWLNSNFFHRTLSIIIYPFIILFAYLYAKLYLHVKIINKRILKCEKGYFLYHNHTQMLGDVFNPFLICFPRLPKIICSASNLGIPFIGKILPFAGALPIPNNIHDMMKFQDAIFYYSDKSPIIIYPEAHLWPYFTKIREFPTTSFHYPTKNSQKVFVATTTYKKSKFHKKPNINIYIDGPILINPNLPKKERIKKLHDEVYNMMLKRSKLSNYNYITYKKKDN